MNRTPSRQLLASLARSRDWQLLITGMWHPKARTSRVASWCRSCSSARCELCLPRNKDCQ